MRPSSLFQLAETKAYKKQNIRLTDQNKVDFLNQKRLLEIIQKKAFKIRFENSGILGVGCREICVFQRVYPVFIFPCKSGVFFFSCFYVTDLSYTVPTIVFLHFRAVFNLYIKVVLRCFFTWDPLSCLRRHLRRISR